MFRSDLVEVLNSRTAWALVGSGASIDAGLPSWRALLDDVLEKIESGDRRRIESDPAFKSALKRGDLPKCFSRVSRVVGRAAVDGAVRERILAVAMRPSVLIDSIVDWPFRGYITTNYDSQLEDRLNSGPQPGWSPVGNTESELPKLAGGAERVIWHIHGAASLPADSSRLVLTSEDYDDQYLDESPLLIQLRSVLALHRLVVLGFGFQDPEVMRILKRVGRLTNPARPIFAFLPELEGTANEVEREELLELYNVDVVPYRVRAGSHDALKDLVKTYSAFTLRRSIQFGQPMRPCPTHHPETTGLLLYNQLVMRPVAGAQVDVIITLLRARILALLNGALTPVSATTISDDLDARAALLQGASWTSGGASEISSALRELLAEDAVEKVEGGFVLTDHGNELVREHAAVATRLSDQFSASLLGRARKLLGPNAHSAPRVATVLETFLRESVEKRALGVALARYGSNQTYQEYHVVALLQALPEFLSTVKDDSEAQALVHLTQQVLAAPSEAEALFIGLSLQAHFGRNLLGYDPTTLRARLDDFRKTVFVIDSSTLIPLLARASPGHSSAVSLIRALADVGDGIVTTEMLAAEVAEHARWAVRKVDSGTGTVTVGTLAAATGRAGERSNAFLEGFLIESSQGLIIPDLHQYLRSVCGEPTRRGLYRDVEICTALKRLSVECHAFSEWEGFKEELWHERDELQKKITQLRKQRETFRHERQVRAEAEALLVVRSLREQRFRIGGHKASNAFFVSQTRILDQVDLSAQAVTLRPEAAFQWAATLTTPPVDELTVLTQGLLWELSERGLTIVNPSSLIVTFGPLATAAKTQLEEEMDRHHAAVSEMYGEPALKAFREVELLDAPVLLHSFNAQRAAALETQLADANSRLAEQAAKRLGAAERTELELLRAKEHERSQRARSKQRANASRRSRRKKKKK